jgi:hypothetical protein
MDFTKFALKPGGILLPEGVDMQKWSVIACDQFTSQPEYWNQVQRAAGGAPSTLDMIYPEAWLAQGDGRIEHIHRAMRQALGGPLRPATDGFVLVERQISTGIRLGLMAAIDLEHYSYEAGAETLIRPTEATIADRIPPRMKIRLGAPLESPHVLLLADDPEKTLLEPLWALRGEMRALYDFDLMLGGGRVRGWAVEGAALGRAATALSALYTRCEGLLFAVGDGNHSLATAKACWESIKTRLSASQREAHPARYALCEIGNLFDDSLVFRPIHRAVFGASGADLSLDFVMWCRARGVGVTACDDEDAQLYLLDAPVKLVNAPDAPPVSLLQPFLDEWIAQHPGASIDYIHGDDALEGLRARGAIGIRLAPMDKYTLFPGVRGGGSLPLKSFSMGDARDKRYYLECRGLLPATTP